jgi:hypothetical protein
MQSAHGDSVWGRITTQSSFAWIGQSAVAGLIAGMMMAMFAMVVAAIAGYGFWAPPRAIASTVIGESHFGGGFDLGSVVLGLAIHMMASPIFGVLYAIGVSLIGSRVPLVVQMTTGIAWGIGLWAINTYVVAPVLPGGQLFTDAMPGWSWFVGHLIFGAMLGVLYALWRKEETSLFSGAGA